MSQSKPKRIALLICDTPPPAIVAAHGDYHALFTRLLHAALPNLSTPNPSTAECTLTLDPFDVVVKLEYPPDEQLAPGGYDGVLITGSKASAYEDAEWITRLVAWTKRVATAKPALKIVGASPSPPPPPPSPLLFVCLSPLTDGETLAGICFGHQIIARALGGQCVPNAAGWEVGPTRITLTDLGKAVFGVESLHIQEMHHDHASLPPTFHLLGSTPVCANQGMVRFSASSPSSPSHPPPSPVSPSASTPASPSAPSHPASTPAPSHPATTAAPTSADITSPVSLSAISILTVQGHPEFTEPIVTKLTDARTAQGIIDADTAADAARRAHWPNDGVGIVGRAVLGVFGVM
ncbi:class I glutamine amidotransferase-like protein [Mycena haematopus]|nr:class I glutamine amidotransferase-like protein [Mycena haematopus]